MPGSQANDKRAFIKGNQCPTRGKGNEGDDGERLSFLFRKKERTKEKPIGSFCRYDYLYWFLGVTDSLYERRRAFADLTRLLAMSQRRGLTRFFFLSHGSLSGAFSGYRESGSLFRRFAPAERVHRHASGAAHSYFGALSALNHKSELSAERYRPAAIRLYERRCFARANHIFELAREGRYGRRASVFVGYTLGERHSNNHAKIIRRQAPRLLT